MTNSRALPPSAFYIQVMRETPMLNGTFSPSSKTLYLVIIPICCSLKRKKQGTRWQSACIYIPFSVFHFWVDWEKKRKKKMRQRNFIHKIEKFGAIDGKERKREKGKGRGESEVRKRKRERQSFKCINVEAIGYPAGRSNLFLNCILLALRKTIRKYSQSYCISSV